MKLKIHILLSIVVNFPDMPGSQLSWLSDAIGGFFEGCVDKATSGVMHHTMQAFRE